MIKNMSKETSIYCDGAIANGIDEAGNTADTYITAVDQNGIKVHAANNVGTNYAGIDATGMDVVKGGTSVAKFGETTRIGKAFVSGASNNESHMELDYHSLKLISRENSEYFYVSDLRGANGEATIVQPFTGDGSTTRFGLYNTATNKTYSVVVSDSSGGTISKTTTAVTFQTAPTAGATITVTYNTTNQTAIALTFGRRKADTFVGPVSVSEGYNTEASALCTHAEGHSTKATTSYAHAEGLGTTASGYYSHAEGFETTASGNSSHAEGDDTEASGNSSHAEGYRTTASNISSHAEGEETTASGVYAHAQNFRTKASSKYQTAIGKCNVEDANDTYALIVGNGTGDYARSNAATIGWDGNYLGQAMAGIIQMFAGATPPNGWLVCDGSAVSRTEYATLYDAIGDTWGAGDGSTTFNLPDLRGRTPIGAGTGTGLTARTLGTHNIGAETHKLTAAESGNQAQTVTSAAGTSHSHGANEDTYFVTTSTDEAISRTNIKPGTSTAVTNVLRSPGGALNRKTATSGESAHKHDVTIAAKNATNAHNNMQPSAVVNFIICTGKTS